jgi:hypothetical protein
MTQEICGDDIYANARVDAGVAEALAGTGEPCWIHAQTSLIRWIRTGHRLAGEPEPGIRSIAETAQNRAKLEALVAKAVPRAKTPDELTEAREMERWLTHEWLLLDAKLATEQTTTLTYAGARTHKATVTSRDGKHRSHVGERTGSGDLWDPMSLPENARRAALEALRELRPSTAWIRDDPGTASTKRATRARPKTTDFEVMTASIDTIEQAARNTKIAQRRLKNDLIRRNKAGKTPDLNERRLRIRALKAAEKLETVATGLRAEITRVAGPQA